jgi:hypothetical protein
MSDRVEGRIRQVVSFGAPLGKLLKYPPAQESTGAKIEELRVCGRSNCVGYRVPTRKHELRSDGATVPQTSVEKATQPAGKQSVDILAKAFGREVKSGPFAVVDLLVHLIETLEVGVLSELNSLLLAAPNQAPQVLLDSLPCRVEIGERNHIRIAQPCIPASLEKRPSVGERRPAPQNQASGVARIQSADKGSRDLEIASSADRRVLRRTSRKDWAVVVEQKAGDDDPETMAVFLIERDSSDNLVTALDAKDAEPSPRRPTEDFEILRQAVNASIGGLSDQLAPPWILVFTQKPRLQD